MMMREELMIREDEEAKQEQRWEAEAEVDHHHDHARGQLSGRGLYCDIAKCMAKGWGGSAHGIIGG